MVVEISIALSDNPVEILISVGVRREEREMVLELDTLFTHLSAVGLYPEHRLDPSLARGLLKLEVRGHATVLGQGDGAVAELRCPGNVLSRSAEAIAKGEG